MLVLLQTRAITLMKKWYQQSSVFLLNGLKMTHDLQRGGPMFENPYMVKSCN